MGDRVFNLADVFELVADSVPDRVALVADPVVHTYAELDRRANRFGHALHDRGVGPGAHVGILARNRAEWVEAMVGCYKARVVPVNLNYRYVAPELRYVVDNADLTALVYERAFSPLVAESFTGFPAPGTLLVVEDGSDGGPEVSGAESYEDALAGASPDRGFGPRSPDDLYLLYTGGTTGMPKGVMWRQEDIFFAAMGGSGWGTGPVESPEGIVERVPTDDTGRVVMLVIGPLMHGNAQWAMWNSITVGGTTVLATDHRFEADRIWRLVERERVVSIALVGDAMARPLAHALSTSPPGTYDTSSVFVVASGGAMLSKTVKQELRSQLPDAIIMDRFGSSESGAQGAVEDGADGPRFVMSDDTGVLDEELRPLRPGDGRMGRLARTGRIPLGYYKDEEKTAATFPVDPDGVRWSVPGDLATVEADGTITVHGRGSACINTGGEKVFPEEVESALKTHPDVFDAIVVGVPDERFGSRVAAAVLPRQGTAPGIGELQDHCRTLIAGYKVPREVVLVAELPMTAAGKPDAKAAREFFGS